MTTFWLPPATRSWIWPMQRDGWRLRHLVREAALNLTSSRRRFVALAGLALTLGTAMTTLSTYEELSLRANLGTLSEAGRGVVVISSSSSQEAAISRTSCERLTDRPDVVRAGFVLTAERLNVEPTGALLPVAQVSATLVPQLGNVDAVIGRALVDQVGAGSLGIEGAWLTTAAGSNQPEGLPLESIVAVAAPISVLDAPACFVVLEQGASSSISGPSLASAVTSAGPPVIATSNFDEPVSYVEQYLERPTRFAPALIAIVIAVVLSSLGAARQSEIASYRIAGTSVRSIQILFLLESAYIGGGVAVSSLASWIVFSELFSVSPAGAFAGVAAGSLIMVFISVFGFLVTRRKLHSQLQER